MITPDTFQDLALSLPGTEEQPHFDRTAFKVTGKRIFATVHEKSNSANIKLSVADQFMFCEYDEGSVYPVSNKWGDQGWTTFELSKVPVELITDALECAYKDVLKSKKR